MAKPAFIQKLEKGKHLNGNNFPEFVETWNYITGRVECIRGDRDTNPQNGHITVDNSDPEHPVIRYIGKKVESSGKTTLVGENESDVIADEVQVKGEEGSGLVATTTLNDGNDQSGVLAIDVADRSDDEEYGGREIEMNGEVIAKVFGTTDFEIKQKTISAGSGITVSEANDIITISTTGSPSLSGYTGSRTVIVDVDYNGHYLRRKYATETWENGLLKTTTTGDWENYHTAVEETV